MSSFFAADASAIRQSSVQTEVAIAVARTAQDQQRQQGAAVLSLLDAAAQVGQATPGVAPGAAPGAAPGPVDPSRGQNLDVAG